jgi:hypothetical protein
MLLCFLSFVVCPFPLFGQTKDRDAKITPLIPSERGGKAVDTIYNSFDIIFYGAIRPFQLSDFLVKVTQYEYGEGDFLGEGVSGRVYRALLKGKNQMVGLKIMRNKLNLTDQEAFLREVEIQAQLRHPAVHPVLGFSLVTSGDKGPVIVTPLMQPNWLKSILQSEQNWGSQKAAGRQNPTRPSKCVFGVASALEYVHSMGVVHADLTPDNIFFDRNFNPVLGDFGQSQYVVATRGALRKRGQRL